MVTGFQRFLIDCADQAVILPLSLITIVLLLGWRRGALAWAASVGGTLGLILLLKLCFISCGWQVLGMRLDSPSGDTASATVVYGGLAGLLVPRGTKLTVSLGMALGVALLFGAALVARHIHSVPEVILGGTIGLAGVWMRGRLAGAVPAGLLPRLRGRAAAAVLLVNLAGHGSHLQAEPVIGRMSVCHAAPRGPNTP